MRFALSLDNLCRLPCMLQFSLSLKIIEQVPRGLANGIDGTVNHGK